MISKSPVVSIIIPSYNRAEKLKFALESCVLQTYKNLEVIVIDDASSDHTSDIINEFESRIAINYIRHSENRGGAYARNTGIKSATGEYLTFLDSDDVYLHSKVFSQLEFFQVNDCPENTILFSPVQLNDGFSQNIFPTHKYNSSDYSNIFDYIFIDNGLVQTNTIFLKTSFAQQIMFDEGLRIHQDYDFILRAQNKNCQFVMMDTPNVVWFCDKREDRIGRIPKFRKSYEWIKGNKDNLSNRAYSHFIVKHLLPQLRLKKYSYDSFSFLIYLLLKQEIGVIDFFKTIPYLLFSKPKFFNKRA